MSEQHTYNIDDLLGKYFAGEALPEEAMFVDEWKNANENNKKYFNDVALLFGVHLKQINSADLFEEIKLELATNQPRKIKLNTTVWWSVAASIVLIASVGLLFVRGPFSSNPDEQILAQVVTEKQLADGSIVTLNKNAELTVKGNFNAKERRIVLKGEAFFEVKHNDKVPFVVECEGLEIKDIGTAFNVKSTPQSDSVFITVTEGIVDVKHGDDVVQLTQHQSVVYSKSTQQFYMQNKTISPNINSYKTKQFSFQETSLQEVIATVNAVYGEVLVLGSDDLGKCLISVDFRNESPQTMAVIITETLGLSYTKQQDKFVITGESCVQ